MTVLSGDAVTVGWVRKIQHAVMWVGILPIVVCVTVLMFALLEPRFISLGNISNLLRQSSYLTVVAMGQMFVLVTGRFDLSVGGNAALTSIVAALVMAAVLTQDPNAVYLAITLGILCGLLTGTSVGILNGIGSGILKINSFIVTLGMASITFGLSLYITGGVPVHGVPAEFGRLLAYGTVLGVSAPILVVVGLFGILYVFLNRTVVGRYLYAVGSNAQSARLSGVNPSAYVFLAHLICGGIASIGGILLTARVGIGEAGIGEHLPLMSITACVIGGVSLSGGTGRIGYVLIGALFIGIINNGMNLLRIDSYIQIMVIGVLLISAVFVDQIRGRMKT